VNESLRISAQSLDTWIIKYLASYDTPAGEVKDVGNDGWYGVSVEEQINIGTTLTNAVNKARAWAFDSGYKVSATKIDYGNNVTIRLRRP
jgi:hypothetical protein